MRKSLKRPATTVVRLPCSVMHTLSKAALFDLVVVLLRRCEDDEDLDGYALYEALREAAEPVLRMRGDAPLPSRPAAS